MQLILREDVPNLGKAGEVVNVRDGFGRNFLLPQKKAVAADPQNLKELAHQQKVFTAQQAKLKTEAEALAQKIASTPVKIARDAGEEGRLFGSVTSKDIAEALQGLKVAIDRRNLKLEEPLKTLGDYEVPVKLHADVTATVKVWVVRKSKT